MANRYTSDYLIASARRQGLIPTAGKLGTADLLSFVDDAVQDYIVPLLLSGREQYLVCSEDQTLVAGQITYPLPSRAVSEAVQQILLVDSAGAVLPLVYVEPYTYIPDGLSGWSTFGFTLRDNSVVLMGGFSGYVTLRVTYFRRPNRVTTVTEAAEVASVNRTTGAVTVVSVPAAFGSAFTADLVQGTPGFRWRAIDQAATVAALVITLPVAAVQQLVPGDFVTLAGESPIPQVPATLHPLVAKRVSCMCLEAIRDQGLSAATKSLEMMAGSLLTTLTPRAQGAARVVMNRFSAGWRRLPYWRR